MKEMYTAGSDAQKDSKAPNPKKAYRTIGIPISLVYRIKTVVLFRLCSLFP